MRSTAILLVAFAARALADPTPPLLPAALLAADGDRVLARTVVPNKLRRQGEVRLVARGDAAVVQTLLATKVLPRVVAEIRKKEERNWPAGAPGHDDMLRYVGALAAAASELRAGAAADDDRRLRVLIEFVANADDGGIVIGRWEGAEVDGRIEPRTRQPIATLAVGRPYLLRNMRLILADAFDLEEAQVGRLGPLGPAAPPPAP